MKLSLFDKIAKFIKPISKTNLKFHLVIVKAKKNSNFYIGQFVSIMINEKADDYYYFRSYIDDSESFKITKEHIDCCEKYRYGIIRNITNDTLEVLIICNDGYLNRYAIETNTKIENGDAFIIKNGQLLDKDNSIIGTIIDERYNNEQKIELNCYENDKLVVFIEK